MKIKHLLRLFVATQVMACSAAYADIYVISNSGTQIAPSEVKEVFTGDKQFAGPTKLIPIDNGPAQEAFLSTVLRMETSRYNTIWTKKSFREGLVPPTVKSGDSEVMDFVRKTPGAVGYVTNQPSGVNVVHKY
jgi:hypothetical protein